MASSPPSNTSSFAQQEQTVRQEMDPRLYALLFGNPNAVGAMALNEASEIAQIQRGARRGDPAMTRAFFGGKTPTSADWLQYQKSFVKPSDPGARYKPQETQKAAQGGLMSLRGYAAGGKPKLAAPTKNETAEQKAKRFNDFIQAGGKLTGVQNTWLSNFNTYAPKIQDGNFAIDPKTGKPAPPKIPQGATQADKDKIYQAYSDATGIQLNAQGKPYKPPANATGPGMPGSPPTMADAIFKKPDFFDPSQQAGTYGGSTNPLYQQAIDKLNAMKEPEEYGKASDLYGQTAAGFNKALEYSPERVAAERLNMERVGSQDVNAERVGSRDISAERVGSRDINAERIAAQQGTAAQMRGPADVNAERVDTSKYTNVTAPGMEMFQMGGPGTWTEKGTQDKYMSPYMQGVIDISKREAERDFQKQNAARSAKAISAGAFGGARQALENAEAERNYAQRLSDMQTQGLQQAYESGRSQFGTEQSMSQQAAIQNLAAKLGIQSQDAAQILQASMANQQTGMQGSLANQQAALQAALANQQTGYNVGAFNAGNQQQMSLANMQQALQAAMANQQTGLSAQQSNQQSALQAALANQSTGLAAQQNNQQAALQAALANQSTGLSAQQSNQQAALQAALANQQMGYNTQYANQQAALQAALANQQAGLTNQGYQLQGLGALGTMAGGLAGVGAQRQGYDQQMFTNYGQAGQTAQNLMNQYNLEQQKNAQNYQFGAQGTLGGIIGQFPGMGSWGGSTTGSQTQRPATAWG